MDDATLDSVYLRTRGSFGFCACITKSPTNPAASVRSTSCCRLGASWSASSSLIGNNNTKSQDHLWPSLEKVSAWTKRLGGASRCARVMRTTCDGCVTRGRETPSTRRLDEAGPSTGSRRWRKGHETPSRRRRPRNRGRRSRYEAEQDQHQDAARRGQAQIGPLRYALVGRVLVR